MKIAHFSDTHLGFKAFEITDENGINIRENDFYEAFSKTVDKILEIKPNFAIHTGDLFHKQSPKNREIAFAIKELKRIANALIPVIIIAGNHSTPKTKIISPILQAFEPLNNIFVVFDRYKKIEFNEIIFHAFPHIRNRNLIDEDLEMLELNIDKNRKNILLMHCSVGSNYQMEEAGEWFFPKDKEYLFEKFEYVALGHWHNFQEIDKNIYYSGSTERTSISDSKTQKGFILTEIGDKLKVEFQAIKLRKTYKIVIDAKEYDSKEKILEYLNSFEIIKNSILDIHFKNLSKELSINISKDDVESIFDTKLIKITRNIDIKILDTIEATEDLKFNFEERLNFHLQSVANDKIEINRLKSKVDEIISSYEEL